MIALYVPDNCKTFKKIDCYQKKYQSNRIPTAINITNSKQCVKSMEFATYINVGGKYFDFYTGTRRLPLRTRRPR